MELGQYSISHCRSITKCMILYPHRRLCHPPAPSVLFVCPGSSRIFHHQRHLNCILTHWVHSYIDSVYACIETTVELATDKKLPIPEYLRIKSGGLRVQEGHSHSNPHLKKSCSSRHKRPDLRSGGNIRSFLENFEACSEKADRKPYGCS